MKKKEIIWREILQKAIENKQIIFQQKNLAAKFGFSLAKLKKFYIVDLNV